MSRRRTSLQAFTLPEMMVALGVAAGALAILMTASTHVSYMMYGLQNYATAEQQSQIALETLAHDVRQATCVASVTTNSLVLSNGANLLTFTYNPTSKTFSRTYTNVTHTLITNCSQLQFTLLQRCSQTNTYDQFPAATASQAKVVEVSWRCSSANAHSPVDSSYLHSARIVIRKE